MQILVDRDMNGRPFGMYEGILCLFDKRTAYVKQGALVDVFVVGVGSYDVNAYENGLPHVVVRPVSPADVLVHHNGFVMHGGMCGVKASLMRSSAVMLEAKFGLGGFQFITPGLTPVRYVTHVGLRYGDPVPSARPGHAYMNRIDLAEGRRCISGVPEISDLDEAIVDDFTSTSRGVRA